MKTARILPIALWLLSVLICLVLVWRTQFESDMSAFLPRSASPSQKVLVDQLREGTISRLVVVALEGATDQTLAEVSRALAASLREMKDFVTVNNGEDVGLEADQNFLWRNRYLLSPKVGADSFSESGLRAALEKDLQLLASPMGVLVKQFLAADPTGEMLGLIDGLDSGARPTMRDDVWFSKNYSRALLMVQTRAAGFDIDSQETALAHLNEAFDRARHSTVGAESVRLVASGPPLFAIDARARMKGDATRFSIIASALVAVVLVVAYRSPFFVVLAFLPVATGALAGMATIALGFGFIHGITLGFGVTLIGEAVDYGIYVLGQTTGTQSPDATLRRIWPTLRLGLLTSIFGFGAMLLSDFPGFVQLGLFTIIGLIAALTVTRFVLPRLLPAGFQGLRTELLSVALAPAVAFAPRLRLLVVAILAAAAVTLALHSGPLWEQEIASMSPVPAAQLRLDQSLRQDIGAPDVRYMVIVNGRDQEHVLEQSEALEPVLNSLVAEGAVSGFEAPHRHLPSARAQMLRQQALPADADLRARFAKAVQGLPFRADAFDAFFTDVAAAKTQALLTRATLEGTNLSLRLSSLLIAHPDAWTGLLPLHNVTDSARIEQRIRALDRAGIAWLDLKTESDLLLQNYLRQATMLSLAGALAITLLLAINLRSARRVALVLTPLAAAVLITAALLSFGTERLSVFNLFGFLLVVAIGSNYCLFFERARTKSDDIERIVASVVLANLCTVIAFGVLSFSAIPVLHDIGLTVAIGTALSLFFSAVMTSPLRERET